MTGKLPFLVAAILVLASGGSFASGVRWPAIAPISVSFPVSIGKQPVVIEQVISSKQGIPLYRFSCRAGTAEQLDALGELEGRNYVAPLICGLGERGGRGVGMLLAEDDSALWFSRGQIHPEELAGACGRYPEFGRVRHFSLRGMLLTLTLRDVVLNRQGLVSATVSLDAAPSAVATAARAGRPGYLPPKNNCGVIVRGNEPRMCRDASFGWTDCAKIGR